MILRADVNHTLDFIKEYVTTSNAKILEVGCGRGDLAAALMNNGFQVHAIDLSPEAVEATRQKGVQAEVADIVQFESAEKFDAVLFTSSLHHVNPLDQAIGRVTALLGEKGRILVEDFAIEQMDEKTADWFYEVKDLLTLLCNEPSGSAHGTDLAPLPRWTAEHTHEPALHSRKEMLRALERKFGNPSSSSAPYLYRYFTKSCETFANGTPALQKVFDWEKKHISKGLIQPIGLRIVAKKYFSYLK